MRLKKIEPWALAIAVLLPTLVTLIYFVLLKEQPAAIQRLAYSIGKGIQFAFPVVWVWLICGQPIGGLFPLRREAIGIRGEPNHLETNGVGADTPSVIRAAERWLSPVGVGFGVLVGVAVFVGFYGVLTPLGLSESLVLQVNEKVARMSLDSPAKFAMLGIFYALVHSYLEEYYWRWFVYRRLLGHVSSAAAVAISSLGFMAHHVILMATFLGWDSPLTYVISGSVAIGGAFWAWLYQRSGRLLWPWISHMIVDAAIFALGYLLVFGR